MTITNASLSTGRVAPMASGVPVDGPPGTGSSSDAPLLPEPINANVDIGQAIATLMIDSAFAQRKTAREAKQKVESAMVGLQKEEIAQMQRAAEEKFTAAQTEAWVQIGTGAVTLGGLAASAGGDKLEINWLKSCGEMASKIMTSGGAELAKGVSGLASSGHSRDADSSKAAAQEASNGASNLKSAIADCGDDIKATKDLVRKALDFMKEYQSAQSQSQAAALHRA